MFYAHYVLSKKGPLAKVWLAAHWDKKLTKAHVFETDVEKTVDNIISPKVKMALRTSGHLLLGVVRIYSRKQKYLIQDLGEACAKIKMAFRPGVVDLPSEGIVASADTITLPEIFHDFETAVVDLGTLEMEEQFIMHRSRAEEITLKDDFTGSVFALEDEFQSTENEFGGMLEDIEIPRRSVTLQNESRISDNSHLAITDDKNGGDSLMEVQDKHTLEDKRLDDAFGNQDYVGDGFGDFGQGGLQDLLNVPNIPSLDDINLEQNMEVDPVNGATDMEQPPKEKDDSMEVVIQQNESIRDEDGFVLEPIEISGLKVRPKRKRKLVVDTKKEMTGEVIRAQLRDCSDTLQSKCFPPPSKKALVWKETASSEQLYQKPTIPFMTEEISQLITSNMTLSIPEDFKGDETLFDLDREIEVPRNGDGAESTINESAIPVPHSPTGNTDVISERMFDMPLEEGRDNDIGANTGVGDLINNIDNEDEVSAKIIPEMPDLERELAEEDMIGSTDTQATTEQQSEEYEQRRWTKRTQQILRMIEKGFSHSDTLHFSDLTRKCSRKQAASRFYTCLLLAKEGAVSFHQKEPFSQIAIKQGQLYTESI